MHLRRTLLTSMGAAAVAVSAPAALVALSGTAGAAPASGDQVGVAAPIGSFVTGTPFQSGQQIDVSVPANKVLNPNLNVVVVECAAPNGVLPTLPSECDPNTVQGPTLLPNANGSLNYNGYQVYALPDAISLAESPSNTPVCGTGVANECVLLIGNSYGDFTTPHFWSQPFQVTPTATDAAFPVNPGDGTPEAPLAIGLPLAAAAVAGGFVVNRRRKARATVA